MTVGIHDEIDPSIFVLVDQQNHVVHNIRGGWSFWTRCGINPDEPEPSMNFKTKLQHPGTVNCLLCIAADEDR